MEILMFRLIWAAGNRTSQLLRYAPANRLMRVLRTRPHLAWGGPAIAIGVTYLLAAASIQSVVDNGGSEWLRLAVLVFAWNGLKFVLAGPGLVLMRLTSNRRNRPRAHG